MHKKLLLAAIIFGAAVFAEAQKAYTLGMIAKSQGNPFFEAAACRGK